MNQSQIIFGLHAVLARLKSGADGVIELSYQSGRHDERLQEILTLAKRQKISAQELSKHELDLLASNASHQGVILQCESSPSYSEADLPSLLENLNEPAFLLILDGVQDPHNLGACLRSANGAGVHAVIIPKDKAVGLTATVRKVASGAAEETPLIQVTNLARTLKQLQDMGIWLYGAADDATESLYTMNFSGAVGIVLGAEQKGLRRLTKENCDGLFSIPMAGSVNSLNVSVAAGVSLYMVLQQRMKRS